MPPEGDDPEQNPPPDGDANASPAGNPPAAPAITSLTPDAVRQSPEYRAQQAAARTAAREQGRLATENARLREEAETARTAAEAQARESQLAGVRSVLGDEGVALYDEIAELSATDPVGAANKIRELGLKLAQTQQQQPPAGSEPAPGDQPAGGTTVPPQGQAPFPPPGGVSASAPVGQPAVDNSWETIGKEAEQRYQDVVATVQGPLSGRNRVTGRMRTAAVMDFLVSSVAKAIDLRQKEARGR